MDVKTGLFYFFSIVLLFAAFRVITARNPVYAVLYLVLAFFQASALWILLQAEFLAIALVLVYVGAVMVLFLFVVMMLDINFTQLREGFQRYLPVGATIGVVLLAELGRMEITSILVEGGPELLGALFAAGRVDQVAFFFAPKIIGNAPTMQAAVNVSGQWRTIGRDEMLFEGDCRSVF